MWGEQVEVVSCDMREWAAPEKADILVSELLGSFGDNELSPECLDGAQRFLNGKVYLFHCKTAFCCPKSQAEKSRSVLKVGFRFLGCFGEENHLLGWI